MWSRTSPAHLAGQQDRRCLGTHAQCRSQPANLRPAWSVSSLMATKPCQQMHVLVAALRRQRPQRWCALMTPAVDPPDDVRFAARTRYPSMSATGRRPCDRPARIRAACSQKRPFEGDRSCGICQTVTVAARPPDATPRALSDRLATPLPSRSPHAVVRSASR